MEADKNNKTGGIIAGFDRFMGRIRHFFGETAAEMRRCTWPGKSELVESTILVIVTIVVSCVFVAVADMITIQFIKFITTGI